MQNIEYSIWIILATLCYAISINTIKARLHDLFPMDIAVVSSFFAFIIPFFIISYNTPVLGLRADNQIECQKSDVSRCDFTISLQPGTALVTGQFFRGLFEGGFPDRGMAS